MGKTYKKIVKNKFEKKKFINLKKRQKFIEDYEEDERSQDEEENLQEVREGNGTS
jgi:hypothetical protein